MEIRWFAPKQNTQLESYIPIQQSTYTENKPNRQNTGNLRVYLEKSGYFAGLLGFASDFAPDQLSDSGKLESCQNGAPNTLWFPWKFPETKSAGDPLVSFLVSGNVYAGQILSNDMYYWHWHEFSSEESSKTIKEVDSA